MDIETRTPVPSLLVVDDDRDTCENLRDILTEQGYRVDIACDGPSALELVRRHVYDVAILDLKMPGMDGVELFRHIRTLQPATVAILTTAYATVEVTESALRAGAWQVLSKPVSIAGLGKLIDEALGQPLVLIVDDDIELCDVLWDVLREQRYRVAMAHELASAERQLLDPRLQVVLIDLKLPDGDGGEVFRRLRDANPNARAVLITGQSIEMEQVVRQVLTEGADAVCYKPFDVPGLLETLRRLTGAPTPARRLQPQ